MVATWKDIIEPMPVAIEAKAREEARKQGKQRKGPHRPHSRYGPQSEANYRKNYNLDPRRPGNSLSSVSGLPQLCKKARTMPNVITLSSLFAPIGTKNGKRPYYEGAIVPSRNDSTVEYWGQQLDEADADILLELVYRAVDTKLGSPVLNVRFAEFLRAIGRDIGTANYQWLDRRIMAIAAAAMLISKHSKRTHYQAGSKEEDEDGNRRLFRFIQDYNGSFKRRVFSYALDPRWPLLFSNEEFGLIDWEQRMAMKRGAIMARALQRLIATSASPPGYRLDMLKERFRYRSSMYKFKQALRNAVMELERVGLIEAGRITRNRDGYEQLVLTRSK